MTSRLRLLPLALVLALSACGGAPPVIDTAPIQAPLSTARLTVTSPSGKTVEVQAELADSPEERETGLMGRTALPEGTGMLFIFPQEQQLYFWMKDTLIPMDVLYFAADGRYLNAETMTPCPPSTADCPIYASSGAALFALEVPPGSAGAWAMGPGGMLELPKVPPAR